MSEAFERGEQQSSGTPEAALSALLDGELSEFEMRRLLDRVAEQPELAETWSRYSLARTVLEGDPCQLASDGFSERVAAAIGHEPLPGRGTDTVSTGHARRWVQPLGRVAVAASVAAAVFLGMELSLRSDDAGTSMMAERGSSQPEATSIDAEAQRRLNEYIQSVAISGDRNTVDDAFSELESLRRTPQLRPVSDRELLPARESRE
ncbi:MAG: sigma-E factor negative regulatory protein [Pseudomonadota bacterium]